MWVWIESPRLSIRDDPPAGLRTDKGAPRKQALCRSAPVDAHFTWRRCRARLFTESTDSQKTDGLREGLATAGSVCA